MKLNFRSLKRKLFGSSPAKKKKKRSSGIRKKAERIVSIILVVFMSMSLVSLVGPTDIFDNDSGPKKTTTASTTVNPDENSVFGERKLKANYTPIEFVWNEQTAEELFNLYGFSIYTGDTAVGFSCILSTTHETLGKMEIFFVRHMVDGVYEYVSYNSWEATDYNEVINSLINQPFYITATNNTTVDEWLLANTEEIIELKAGTYRLNDVLGEFPEIDLGNAIEYFIPISFNYNGTEYLCMFYGWLAFDGGAPLETLTFMETYPTYDDNEPEIPEITIWAYQPESGNSYVVETPVYITINRDTGVVSTFASWFIHNTDYNEVNSTK